MADGPVCPGLQGCPLPFPDTLGTQAPEPCGVRGDTSEGVKQFTSALRII